MYIFWEYIKSLLEYVLSIPFNCSMNYPHVTKKKVNKHLSSPYDNGDWI
jgi:hypothetical protein